MRLMHLSIPIADEASRRSGAQLRWDKGAQSVQLTHLSCVCRPSKTGKVGIIEVMMTVDKVTWTVALFDPVGKSTVGLDHRFTMEDVEIAAILRGATTSDFPKCEIVLLGAVVSVDS